MKKHNLFPYVRLGIFLLTVFLFYVFWEWGGARSLEESVGNHAAVEAHFLGTAAPDFAVPAARMWAKQNFQLRSLHGHPIVLHFWATWCAPCLQELPELIDFAKKARAQGFSIVTVAVDDSWAKLETFFSRYPNLAPLRELTLLALDPEGKIAEAFGSSRFPESFLINDQLLIDNKLIGAQPWTSPQMEPYLERLRSGGKTK